MPTLSTLAAPPVPPMTTKVMKGHHGNSRFSVERKGRWTGTASIPWLLPWWYTKRWTGVKFSGFWTSGISHCNIKYQHLIYDKSTLVQIMVKCRQATNLYLNLCWRSSMTRHGVTRPQWVNTFMPEQNTHPGCLISDIGYSSIQCPLSIVQYSVNFTHKISPGCWPSASLGLTVCYYF